MKLELRHKSRYPWIQFNFRERRRSRPSCGLTPLVGLLSHRWKSTDQTFPIEHDYHHETDIVLVHGAFVIGAGWLRVYEILIRDRVLGPVSGQSAIWIWLLPKSVCPDAMTRTRSVSGCGVRNADGVQCTGSRRSKVLRKRTSVRSPGCCHVNSARARFASIR
jgi:hypothetical protein